MVRWPTLLAGMLLVGCGAEQDGPSPDADCDYPSPVSEPMAQDEVIAPYAWPTALPFDRVETSLNLAEVHCNTDDALDWSPFEMLLFVSIPAW